VKLKYITTIHLVTAGILWLLGILVMVFNLLDLWIPWNMAILASYLYMPVPIAASAAAMVLSARQDEEEERKYWLRRNGIVLAVSAVVTVLTVYVFSIWIK